MQAPYGQLPVTAQSHTEYISASSRRQSKSDPDQKHSDAVSGHSLFCQQYPTVPPAKREQELHVCGSLAVEAQLFLIVVAITYLILFKTQRTEPVKAELLPVCKPFKVCIRLTEKFQLHLLKLTGTEGKVSRSDLITERFTDLSDSKWNFLSGGSLYILKVYENTLRGFRTKVYGIFASSVTPWKVLNIRLN